MITDEIYERMSRKYPAGPAWTSSSFRGYGECPLEIRFLLSSDKLEFEVGNGGLPQFLWNTFYHWRWVLADCEAGYALIGAHRQVAAISEFRTLCEIHEDKCRKMIEECIRTNDFRLFNEWVTNASVTLRSDLEPLFFSDSGLSELKSS